MYTTELNNHIGEWKHILENTDQIDLSSLPNLELKILPSKQRLKRCVDKQAINIEYSGMPLAGKTTLVLNSSNQLYLTNHVITQIPEFMDFPKSKRTQLYQRLQSQYKMGFYLAQAKTESHALSKKYSAIKREKTLTKPRMIINERGVADLLIGEFSLDIQHFSRLIESTDDVFPTYKTRVSQRSKAFKELESVDILVIGDVSLKKALERRLARDKPHGIGTFVNKEYFKASKIAYRHFLTVLLTQLKHLGIGLLILDGDNTPQELSEHILGYLARVEYEYNKV